MPESLVFSCSKTFFVSLLFVALKDQSLFIILNFKLFTYYTHTYVYTLCYCNQHNAGKYVHYTYI